MPHRQARNRLYYGLLCGALLALTAGCDPDKAVPRPETTADLPPAHPPLTMPVTGSPTQAASAGQLPADHPPLTDPGVSNLHHPKSGAQTTVQVPPAVKAKWKAVQLAVRRPGGTEQVARVAIGDLVAVPDSPRAIRVVAFLPAFTSNAGTATSSSNEPKNPAVLLELTDGKQTLERGWVFQNLPDFNTFASDTVQARLLGGLTE